MKSTQERLLRAYAAVHGDIDDHDDYVGFGVWKAVHATPELEVEYNILEVAQVRQGRYVERYRRGYDTRYSELPETLDDETVPLPDVHLEDCAGPEFGAI